MDISFSFAYKSYPVAQMTSGVSKQVGTLSASFTPT